MHATSIKWLGAQAASAGAANGSKKPVPPEKQLAIVAPITADRCPLPYGAICLKQAFVNKRDYAMLHSHEFHAYPVAKDPAAPGTWYRLLLLKQVDRKSVV